MAPIDNNNNNMENKEMNDIQRSLGRIEGKMDQYLHQNGALEKRVTTLELQQDRTTAQLYKWGGALAAFMFIVTFLKGSIIKLVGGV